MDNMPKNVWKPTEKELDEMGFIGEYDSYSRNYQFWNTGYADVVVNFKDYDKNKFKDCEVEWLFNQVDKIYPESRQDVETLIRLMTP